MGRRCSQVDAVSGQRGRWRPVVSLQAGVAATVRSRRWSVRIPRPRRPPAGAWPWSIPGRAGEEQPPSGVVSSTPGLRDTPAHSTTRSIRSLCGCAATPWVLRALVKAAPRTPGTTTCSASARPARKLHRDELGTQRRPLQHRVFHGDSATRSRSTPLQWAGPLVNARARVKGVHAGTWYPSAGEAQRGHRATRHRFKILPVHGQPRLVHRVCVPLAVSGNYSTRVL